MCYTSNKLKFLSLAFLLGISPTYAQPSLKISESNEYLEVGFFIHSVSLPFKASNHLIGFNRFPGITIGFSKHYKEPKGKLDKYFYHSISYYHQKELHKGLELSSVYTLDHKLRRQFGANGGMGLGYLHTFEDAPIYKLKDGKYKQVRDWGRPQFTPSVKFGLTYLISSSYQLAVNYQFALQLPFAKKAGVLFIPHNRIYLSVRKIIHK
jgi:hypothetical protein